ncbi:acetyl-CoA carboxylase biotin carboxylase subunit [Sphingosinicella microcystinivorans]|uniref:acetyl-CoA carboxylase biotin carboxylase subunit n=1 Tax=Sphingosinicella microcystinivorans TaxID=335406 RepID=UPI0022F39832|nr:biotin carboxylase N-terminal domain-containing protein [Sphingosinicella microcystinivorans]WBX85788.1 biotin carboxylase N-terminal domain-containing protein [Sphingosinicella microcystinivorans]
MPDTAPSNGRLFVANRGEIALRTIRAAQALGMEVVLGVSAADRDGLGARTANRCVVLGPAQARDSYLNAGLIVHAAVSTGCTALHPGYGFLSERAELAELCAQEGITFVGPTPESIRQVGDKISARAMARAANVPMTSGTDAVEDVAHALKLAEEIGYPVITKASAGGGGRGMVVARNAEELAGAFDQAVMTAREAFGDGTLFIERYVEVARHIEVQVIGDGKGGVVHFGERDCSIQRRYQKMIEEAPAAILSPAVRKRLHEAAVRLLASINYRNAGTVEFLYDTTTEEFFFMEVNARIQVEHPVSEAITGADLVQAQLKLATGAVKGFAQKDVHTAGHAIEARIIAEDPDRDFIPCPGRITRWSPPSGEGIRVDTAVETGTLIPPYYDSMIAKLIVHGNTRVEAIDRLAAALDDFVVEGIATNIPLLKLIVAHEDFRSNTINTRWLETVLLPAFRVQQGR